MSPEKILDNIKTSDNTLNVIENNPTNVLNKTSSFKILPNESISNPTIKSIEYTNDSLYEGQIKYENIKHGIGRMAFSSNGFYFGQWSDDEIYGFGTLYSDKNEIIYEGFWQKDKFHGLGVLYNIFIIKNNEFEIDFHNFNQIEDKWVRYEGEFNNDLRDGKGRLEFANGDILISEFKLNSIDGEGIFIRKSNGLRIIGVWQQNSLVKILQKENFEIFL